MRKTEFKSFTVLNYQLTGWTIFGLRKLNSQNKFKVLAHQLYSILIIAMVFIYLPGHMVLGLFQIEGPRDFIESIANTCTMIIGAMKAFMLWKYFDSIFLADEISEEIGLKLQNEDTFDKSMEFYKSHSRKYSNSYAIAYGFCVFLGAFTLFAKISNDRLFVPGYFPFDPRCNDYLFIAIAIFQYLSWTGQAISNILFDTFPAILMFKLVEYMKINNFKISQIGYDSSKPSEDHRLELIETSNNRKLILSLNTIINKIIAPSTFGLYLVSALNIVACLIIGQNYCDTLFEKSYYYVLMVCYGMQTALISYYGSEYEYEIHRTTKCLYTCNWYEQDRVFLKDFRIFMENSLRGSQFLAGGYIPINKITYLNIIIKSTFSLYTLLNKVRDKFA